MAHGVTDVLMLFTLVALSEHVTGELAAVDPELKAVIHCHTPPRQRSFGKLGTAFLSKAKVLMGLLHVAKCRPRTQRGYP
jgi:hypothetical protein